MEVLPLERDATRVGARGGGTGRQARGGIATVDALAGLKIHDVLAELRDDLELLGFVVETGKTKMDKVARAVLYGEGGVPEVNYEIDGFHDGFGIALEVEAGRGAANDADYRDIVRSSLILDAQFLDLDAADRLPVQDTARRRSMRMPIRARNSRQSTRPNGSRSARRVR